MPVISPYLYSIDKLNIKLWTKRLGRMDFQVSWFISIKKKN